MKSIALITVSVLLVLAGPNAAMSIGCWLSDETGFDFHDPIYGPGEIIYITGEWDIYDFPCPIGYVYLVSNDRSTWENGRSIAGVTVKTIQGCGGAGAFYGAVLKLPPLPMGEYDIIMDENQNGTFDTSGPPAGPDYALGNGTGYALKVVDMVTDPVDVAAIKAAAAANASDWRLTGALFRTAFFVAGAINAVSDYYNLAVSVGEDFATVVVGGTYFFGIPRSYNGAVMTIARNLMNAATRNTALVYQDIADDPPDPNYTEFALVDSVSTVAEVSADSLTNAVVRVRNNLALQNVVGDAFRVSYERLLGADDTQNYEYALLQARYAKEYSELMNDLLDVLLVQLTEFESAIHTTGWIDTVFSAGASQSLQQRITTAGFTTSEVEQMLSVGMTLAEVDSAEAAIVGLDLADLVDSSFRGQIDSLRVDASETQTHFDTLGIDLGSVLDRLQHVFTNYPMAVISGLDSIPEGLPLALDGLESTDPQGDVLSMAWDLDLDGVFDDGNESSVSFISNYNGEFMVALQVTDPSGNSDVAYKRIMVTDINRIPEFSVLNPNTLFIVMDLQCCSQAFSALAQDPDDDDLTYTWLLDGQEIETGQDYVFEPALSDTGLHHIAVRISDGSPLSHDNYHIWRLRVVVPCTGVADSGSAPNRYRLAQNYPNPFNPYTVIRYELPEPARVSIRVYDVSGRLVSELLNTVPKKAGRHVVRWEGTTRNGKQAASGVYFCHFEAGVYRETRRMVLLR